MTPQEISDLEPALDKFLKQFENCFVSPKTFAHLKTYSLGLLSHLTRKSVEPIALEAGVPPKTLQQFLSIARWDHDCFRKIHQQTILRNHPSKSAIGIIDDTGCPKKGDKTPGVQSQYCGNLGKVANCVVTVHLTYATHPTPDAPAFAAIIDSDLFLPEKWAQDRQRCRDAAIPDSLDYRPKWQIALEQYDRARENDFSFNYICSDTWYGDIPGFHLGLQDRNQHYVLQVACDFLCWPGDSAKSCQNKPPVKISELVNSSVAMTNQPWQSFNIGSNTKGPRVWEAKRATIIPKLNGQPGKPLECLVARNASNHKEIKYFLSHCRPWAPTTELLRAAFSRWQIEENFETLKSGLGLDHYEGRTYAGLVRHHFIAMALLAFVLEAYLESKKKISQLVSVWQLLTVWKKLSMIIWDSLGNLATKAMAKLSQNLAYRQKRNDESQKSAAASKKAKLLEAGVNKAMLERSIFNTS